MHSPQPAHSLSSRSAIPAAAVAKQFLAIFLPTALFVVVCAWQIRQVDTHTRTEFAKLRQRHRMEIAKQLLVNGLSTAVSDLYLLARHPDTVNALEQFDPRELAVLERHWSLFAGVKKNYNQIRLMDITGMEMARVEYAAGHSRIVSRNRLRFRGGNALFYEVFQLGADEIHIWPMELKTEKDAVQEPFTPVIRIETPLFDASGRKKGLIILSHTTGPLLRTIRETLPDRYGTFMLLNDKGYWLMGPEPAKEWAFMFPERKNQSFASEFPEIWKEISGNPSGQMMSGEMLVTFDTVYPLSPAEIQEMAEVHHPEGGEAEQEAFLRRLPHWKVLSLVDRQTLTGPLLRIWGVASLVVGFLALFCLAIARELSFRRADHERLTASEASLFESEQKLRALFDQSFGFIGLLTPDGKVVDANETALNFIGATIRDVIGKPFWDTPWWNHSKALQDQLRRAVRQAADGEAVRFQTTHISSAGAERVVDFSLKPAWGDNGTVAYLIPEGRDITDIKRARDERDRIFNLSPDLICIGGMDGYFKRVNPSFYTTLGYSDDEIRTQSFFSWIHPDDQRFAQAALERLGRGESTIGFECRFRSRDRGYLWLTWAAVPVIQEGVFYAVGRNTTENRNMFEALKEREARIRAIVETAVDGIITIDEQCRIRHFNPAAERIFGYRSEEAIGRNVSFLMPEPYRSRHDDYVRSYLKSGRARIIGTGREVVGCRKDGSTFPLDLAVNAVDLGNRKLFTGLLRDITDRKKNEADLKQAKEKAEVANRAKSDFLASMSHEIRTPMNAIIGMAELLSETELSDDQRKYVKVFHTAGENLLAIINDILDLSKIEEGKIHLERADFNLYELIEGICDIMAMRAHEKDLELNCFVHPDVPAGVVGDSVRLRQVLVNLMGNAVKFTEKGEVFLQVGLNSGAARPMDPADGSPSQPDTGSPAGMVAIDFSVSDTGIGIPENKIASIFERFTQADASTTRKFGGTGLGLTISKRLVEMMAGTLRVESREGGGTTFSFRLPFVVSDAVPSEISDSMSFDLEGLRALVVDDNETNRLILRKTLERWGVAVDDAESGRAAMNRLLAARRERRPYEIVLLDCRMPEMDGFEVAQQIRKISELAQTTLMMLTSDNRPDDFRKVHDLDIAGYLEKPVKRSELKSALNAALGRRALPTAEAPPPPPAQEAVSGGDRAPRILLVDDSPDNRLLVRTFLKGAVERLDEAEDGRAAVERFQAGDYDMVLMDVQMPVMDGHEATREIRRWEKTNGRPETPIVALTAHALKEDEQKSLDAGCTAHMSKPIKKKKLLETITRFRRQT